jgi:hypothetical protein
MISIITKKYGEVKLSFSHIRNDSLKNPRVKTFTTCELFIPSLNFIIEDVAFLHPSDQFNKATGRELSLQRVLSRIVNLDNDTRNEILKGYANR